MSFFARRRATALRAEAVAPSRRQLLALGCACCTALAAPVSQAAAQSPAVQQHLALARAAAGDDLTHLLRLGEVAAPTPGLRLPTPDEQRARPTPPPARAFDNLVFLGNHWVSAWALLTSDGIIVIDGMDHDAMAERDIEGGLRRMGLDPAQVKLMIVTHGHADHYGGCGHFTRRYGTRVVMSETDWQMLDSGRLEFDRPELGRPPRRDISVGDGSEVRLGDTVVRILSTPGHTRGTISPIIDLKLGGATHRALLWGGTSFNFGRQPDRLPRLQSYIDGTARARQVAGEQEIDVFLSNHSSFDLAIPRLERMRDGGPNLFVTGVPATQRALTVMHECARATMAAWTA
ncbi:MBL fold metallo-hydrolase [Falsiroseomonas tokyonensis]|uniref:MBL fold metallo-hydrolase n=1 Tax=Falsiroseomonas tokyonensis TaxID=430521 RepID=A0ABV7BMS4_9PROT|nr:MBL fold metallo-hydrolase [Falsiroseomonas tokyonensis]MBU8536363.1 MBL fold metallo-hydrolase [Falsiroseomonas tokyonensis]